MKWFRCFWHSNKLFISVLEWLHIVMNNPATVILSREMFAEYLFFSPQCVTATPWCPQLASALVTFIVCPQIYLSKGPTWTRHIFVYSHYHRALTRVTTLGPPPNGCYQNLGMLFSGIWELMFTLHWTNSGGKMAAGEARRQVWRCNHAALLTLRKTQPDSLSASIIKWKWGFYRDHCRADALNTFISIYRKGSWALSCHWTKMFLCILSVFSGGKVGLGVWASGCREFWEGNRNWGCSARF